MGVGSDEFVVDECWASYAMTELVFLCLGLTTSAWAVPVSFTYQITTKGSGPGLTDATATGQHRMVSYGTCGNCVDPGFPMCVSPEGVMYADLPGLALTPAGEDNIQVTFAGGATYIGTNQWSFSDLTCGPCHTGGGLTGAGTASSGSFSARIPFSGGFRVTVPMDLRRGTCSIYACGCPGCVNGPGCCACNLGPEPRCCGTGADVFNISITYKKQSANAPKACTQSGAAEIEPDSLWHAIVGATCMTDPDTPTAWTCMVSGVSGPVFVEGRMVADKYNPSSGNGGILIARAIPLTPCPPNCPPPDPCLACLTKAGKTLVLCQAEGACPGGCPPFCPPPPGCPADPSQCPPPPKCPPYCPPPAGCPDDPSKCPQGCPPVCPPSAGCPDDPTKCPEPPPCPPNCPPPDACQECLTSGKTQGECEANGSCPSGCPPKCSVPAGCE